MKRLWYWLWAIAVVNLVLASYCAGRNHGYTLCQQQIADEEWRQYWHWWSVGLGWLQLEGTEKTR